MTRALAVGVLVVAIAGWSGCVGSAPSDTGTSNPLGNYGTGSPVPELGTPISLSIVSESYVDADIHVLFYVGPVEVHRTDLRVPARTTMRAIGPDLAIKITVEGTYVDGLTTPSVELIAGRDFQSGDEKVYLIPDALDQCPDDPEKREPGVCGCGAPDTDADADGTPDCIDTCPEDPGKTTPGLCGCGTSDVDTDGDGVPDCLDGCPLDKDKTSPGICGCGNPDTDRDHDGTPDCLDSCPDDSRKTAPGVCGCGVSDRDSDGDGVPDCHDGCPNDPNKTSPGSCGCGNADVPGCAELDYCPDDPVKTEPGICGCGVPDITSDLDGDGVYDCVDHCPATIPGLQVDVYGCPAFPVKADFDRDGDVDQTDFAVLQFCMGRENLGQDTTGCAVADLYKDGKIDAMDVSRFMCYMSGDSVPAFRDCNQNGIHDCDDIHSGTSSDLNGNDIPDECEAQACCTTATECLEVIPSVCESLGGSSHGVGSTCAQTQCSLPYWIACCLPDGACELMPYYECISQGGSYAGTSCDYADCSN